MPKLTAEQVRSLAPDPAAPILMRLIREKLIVELWQIEWRSEFTVNIIKANLWAAPCSKSRWIKSWLRRRWNW